MIKVAQVLAGAANGGAENFFVRLVTGLHETGETQQVAFIRAHEHRMQALRNAGVSVQGFRFGGPLNVVDNWRYRQVLKAENPDIVMTWMNRASKATPRGRYTLVSRLGHYYDLKYYRHSDYWVGIAKGICDHIIRGGMPANRVFHIPNFADETPVQPLPRTSFDTPTGVPLLIAAGRLHVNKGFDVLFKAMQGLPEAWLWLAGAGPEEQALKQLAQSLGVANRIKFLGWRNDVTTLMKSGDMFVCPSRHEGLGSIVMESWAHACPIVATNSQGPGEVIESGKTGIVTPLDEVEPLREAIQQLLDNSALRQQLADNGRAHYNSHYSKAVIVNRYNELYADLAQKKPG